MLKDFQSGSISNNCNEIPKVCGSVNYLCLDYSKFNFRSKSNANISFYAPLFHVGYLGNTKSQLESNKETAKNRANKG